MDTALPTALPQLSHAETLPGPPARRMVATTEAD